MTEKISVPDDVLLQVKNLKMHFPIRKGLLQRVLGYVRAVDGVNFAVKAGETLSLVGESGCGKTTTGRCILRAYDPTAGEILYRRPDGQTVDLAKIERHSLKPYRREIRMIFQDPYSSLNPRMNVLDIVGESLHVNDGVSGSALEDRVAALLRQCGLRPEYMHRYPTRIQRRRAAAHRHCARAGAQPAAGSLR